MSEAEVLTAAQRYLDWMHTFIRATRADEIFPGLWEVYGTFPQGGERFLGRWDAVLKMLK